MPTIDPVFLGADKRLFGMHHKAQGFLRHEALVIAPPLLNEGMRAHAMLRSIALRAAKAGYEVLRFDFAGMANSAGRVKDYSVNDWLADLASAARFVVDNAEVDRLSAVSGRASSTLVHHLSQNHTLHRHVCWDPVLSGTDWLTSLHASRQNLAYKFRHSQIDVAGIYQGHEVAADFDEDLQTLSSTDLRAEHAVAVLSEDYESGDTLSSAGYETVTTQSVADWESTSSQTHVVHDVVSAMVGALK